MRPSGMLLALAALAAGCTPAPAAPRAPLPPAAPTPAATTAAAATGPVRFLEDDVDGAMARARSEGKAVFVDVWAPWCHTCLSMKTTVLADPALGAYRDRVVFVAI